MKPTISQICLSILILCCAFPAVGQRLQRPHFYGLFIGISDYSDPNFNLKYSASDAASLAANLQSCAEPAYGEAYTHIKSLTTDANRQSENWPTKENIAAAFRDIAAKVRPGDVFFLFLSGLGEVTNDSLKKQFYFPLPDFFNHSKIEDSVLVAQTQSAISTKDLFEWMLPMSTNKKIIVSDCPRAGQMIVDYKRWNSYNALETNAYPGIYLLAGAQPDGIAYEAPKFGGGLMVYSFNHVLSGKSLIGNTIIHDSNSKPEQRIDINTALHYSYLLTQEVAREVGQSQVPMVYISPASENFDLGFVNDKIKVELSDQNAIARYLEVNLLQNPEFNAKSTGRPINLIIPNGHSRPVSAFDYSPDSLYLLTGSVDKTARLWDTARNEIVVYRGHTGVIEEVAFAGGGQRVLTKSSDGTVKLWTLDGREIVSLDKVNDMAVSNDGRFFLTAGNNNNSTLRDLEGKPIGAPFQHPSIVTQVAISGDGNTFLTYGLDNTAIRWDKNGHQLSTLEIKRLPRRNDHFQLSKDGNHIFCGTVYGPDRYNGEIWSSTGELLVQQEGRKMLLDENGAFVIHKLLIDKTTLKFDSGIFEIKQTAKDLMEVDLVEKTDLPSKGQSFSNRSICFSPNAGNLVLISLDETCILWDMTTNSRRPLTGIKTSVVSTAFAPDGRSFITAEENGQIRVWDIAGQPLDSFNIYGNILKILFYPDGRQLLVVCEERILQLTLSGKVVASLSRPSDDPVFDAAIAPDGTSILIGGMTAKLTGKQERDVTHPEQNFVSALAFSPDSTVFLTAGGIQGTAILSNSPDPVLKIKMPFSQAAFSEDSQYILLGSGNLMFLGSGNRLYREDLLQPGEGYLLSRDGRLLHILRGHTEPITALGFHSNHRHIYTVSSDGTIKFWDRQSGKEVGTYIQLNATDWVVTSPTGLFDASPGAMNSMYFVYGLDIIELEQLKERYYEPGLLAKLLGFSSERLRPVAAFDSIAMYPRIQLQLDSVRHQLRIALQPRDGGMGKLSVFVNNKEIIEDALQGAGPDRSRDTSIVLDLEPFAHYFLTDTLNTVAVRAYNRENWLRSPLHTLSYRPEFVSAKGRAGQTATITVSRSKRNPALHLLLVGVADYAGSTLDLKYSAKDAEDMAAALRQAGGELFGTNSVFVHLLSTTPDSLQPTKANIKAAFEAITARAKAEDILLAYFSGHGVNYGEAEKSLFYFLTMETGSFDLSDPGIRAARAISSEELTRWINLVPAQKQVLIVDACNSGKMVEDMGVGGKSLTASQIRALERMKDRTGMFILSGSAADQESFETNRFRQSLLTYSLLEAMQGAALNDGDIDVMRLFDRARTRVLELAEKVKRVQEPVIHYPRNAGAIFIGRVNDRVKIQLAPISDIFISSIFQEETQFNDPLGLAEAVNSHLREEDAHGADFLFFDLKNIPDAYSIHGRYTLTGDIVTVRARLFRGKTAVGEELTVTGHKNALPALVEEIVRKVNTIPR